MERTALEIALVASMAGVACDGGSAAPVADAAVSPDASAPLDPGTPELPPMGQASIEVWLRAAHHRSWACETGISAARLNGAHGKQRNGVRPPLLRCSL